MILRFVHHTVRERFAYLISSGPLVALEFYILAAMSFILLFEDKRRLGDPGFDSINETVRWSPLPPNITWSLIFFGCILLQLIAIATGINYFGFALRVSSLPFFMWAILLTEASHHHPSAPLTDVAVYSGIALFFWATATIMQPSPDEQRNDEKPDDAVIRFMIEQELARQWKERIHERLNAGDDKPPTSSA